MANKRENQKDITDDPQTVNKDSVPDIEKKSPGDDVPEAPPEPEKRDREAGLQPIFDEQKDPR